jgi:hypothetical protein
VLGTARAPPCRPPNGQSLDGILAAPFSIFALLGAAVPSQARFFNGSFALEKNLWNHTRTHPSGQPQLIQLCTLLHSNTHIHPSGRWTILPIQASFFNGYLTLRTAKALNGLTRVVPFVVMRMKRFLLLHTGAPSEAVLALDKPGPAAYGVPLAWDQLAFAISMTYAAMAPLTAGFGAAYFACAALAARSSLGLAQVQVRWPSFLVKLGIPTRSRRQGWR